MNSRLEALSEGHLPSCESLGFEKTLMAIGADGVMVPFRPNGGFYKKNDLALEGIVAWLQKR